MAVWLLSLVFSGCLALPGMPSPYHPGQDLIDLTLQTQGESRIVGGGDAQISDFPWQASLESSGQHICGAIILNEDFVLTAAHCVGSSASSYTIHVGSSSLSGSGGSKHGVSAVTPHENFINSGSSSIGAFPNDVAVMKLSSSISFDQNKQPISLTSVTNAQLANYNEEDCVITGWGRTNGNGDVSDRTNSKYNSFSCDVTPGFNVELTFVEQLAVWTSYRFGVTRICELHLCSLPNILQKTSVKIMTDSACAVPLGSSLNSEIHICVDGAGSSGGCNGDSGGPLVCRVDNDFELAGVTSFVFGKCLTTYPTVYAETYAFRTWVQNTINSM